MTERPRRQRRLALGVLLAAAVVAVAVFPLRATWWGGWILAIAEAGIVGGLADWFAVTALFRRPLGLPIPHTALIPANWELMAARVGTMVGSRVLTKEYVAQEIARVDVASLIARGAERLSSRDLDLATRELARWLAAEMSPKAASDAVTRLRDLLLDRPLAPALAAALQMVHRHGWDQRVVAALAGAVAEALERPTFRATVGELVDDLLARYRERMGVYPRFWIGVASMLGLIDRERVLSALGAGLRQVAQEPDHPVRQRLMEAMAELPGRLRTDGRLAERIEGAKRELLATPIATRVVEDAAAALHRMLLADLERPARRCAPGSWIGSSARAGRWPRTRISGASSTSGPRRGCSRSSSAITSGSPASSRTACWRWGPRAPCGSSRSTRGTTCSTSASTVPSSGAWPAGCSTRSTWRCACSERRAEVRRRAALRCRAPRRKPVCRFCRFHVNSGTLNLQGGCR